MKLSSLNEWLSLTANIGVLVGLVFLIVEINQSNRIAIATVEGETRSMSLDANTSIAEDPAIAAVLAKLRSDEELTPTETEQLYYFTLARMNIWSTAQAAFNNGLMTEANYERYMRTPGLLFDRYPRIIPFFNEVVDDFQVTAETGGSWARIIQEIRSREQ